MFKIEFPCSVSEHPAKIMNESATENMSEVLTFLRSWLFKFFDIKECSFLSLLQQQCVIMSKSKPWSKGSINKAIKVSPRIIQIRMKFIMNKKISILRYKKLAGAT